MTANAVYSRRINPVKDQAVRAFHSLPPRVPSYSALTDAMVRTGTRKRRGCHHHPGYGWAPAPTARLNLTPRTACGKPSSLPAEITGRIDTECLVVDCAVPTGLDSRGRVRIEDAS